MTATPFLTGTANVSFPTFTVNLPLMSSVKPKVIITVKDLIKYYGSPDRFIVNIKDSEGRPIAGQIVYITLNGRTYNKTTDNKGMASIGVNLNSGNYTATVTVNETKLTAKITVLSVVLLYVLPFKVI